MSFNQPIWPRFLPSSTVLAIATQNPQSRQDSGDVPNARCRTGRCTTRTCIAIEAAIAPQSHMFVNRPAKALRSSDLEFTTLDIWNSINVVNAIVWP